MDEPTTPTINFNLGLFEMKKTIYQGNPEEYYLRIAQEAVLSGLLTDSEFKKYSATFLKIRELYPHMSIGRTVLMLERIIKSRYEYRHHELVTQAQSDDDFLDRVINHHHKNKNGRS